MKTNEQKEIDAREAAIAHAQIFSTCRQMMKCVWDAAKEFYQPKPMDAVLWCPKCFEQHIDEDRPEVCESCGFEEDAHHDVDARCSVFEPWLNPPHKSHRCNFCNHVWRPAEGPTNGVQSLQKHGERDGSAKPVAFANKKDFDDAVEIATRHQPKCHGVCQSLTKI